MSCGKVTFFLIFLVAKVLCDDDESPIMDDPITEMADDIQQFIKEKKVDCSNYKDICRSRILDSAALTKPKAEISSDSIKKNVKSCQDLFRPIVCNPNSTDDED